jgi:endoglucanase
MSKSKTAEPFQLDLDLLKKILTQPSAPFRERHVIELVSNVLQANKVPYFSDPVGNIVIGCSSKKEYQALMREKTNEPLRVYIAHMDHPGFHGTGWTDDGVLEIQWHGGSPTEHIVGSRVWLASHSDYEGYGEFRSFELHSSGRAVGTGKIKVDPRLCTRFPSAKKLYGGFAFREPCWQEGNVIYTKAADDLVGSFSILSLALKHFSGKGSRKKSSPPFLGLLTRAEEVGFIGAIGHFELGWITAAKRPVLCISLETSRTFPGADIGKGPVVRLGDKYTVFHAESLRVFTELAAKVLPGKHQRRVMDGGTCEATVSVIYGVPCVGISIPLGNYHNQSFEGGSDSRGPMGPAPEFVHLDDVQGLLELCQALLRPKLPWKECFPTRRKGFQKDFQKYKKLLASGP